MPSVQIKIRGANDPIFQSALVAESASELFWGMIVKRSGINAMVFPNTSVVHTFGMRCELDIVFVSKTAEVLMVKQNVQPNRVIFGPKGTNYVLETLSDQSCVETLLPVGSQIEIVRA